MYDEGFGAGVADLVMRWIAAGDDLPPCAKMPDKTLQVLVPAATFSFHHACLTQQQ